MNWKDMLVFRDFLRYAGVNPDRKLVLKQWINVLQLKWYIEEKSKLDSSIKLPIWNHKNFQLARVWKIKFKMESFTMHC